MNTPGTPRHSLSSADDASGRTGWRTSKACQECRKRKIKCNGNTPCEMCGRRRTPCVYREITRQRKKKRIETANNNPPTLNAEAPNHRQGSTTSINYGDHQQSHADNLGTIHSSVCATAQMGPPGCKQQLYYGPTSHFSLLQHIYRCLTSDSTDASQDDGEVEEAAEGLDWSSLSRIFFGTSNDNTASELPGVGVFSSILPSITALSCLTAFKDPPVFFVSNELARLFMDNFLSTAYVLCPSHSQRKYRQMLDVLYQSGQTGTLGNLDEFNYHHLLMALALGAPIYYGAMRLQQSYAHYQNEQGRPNSAFLHMGTATRKAVAAGLHKAPQRESDERAEETFAAQNDTLWCLYFYETYALKAARRLILNFLITTIVYPQSQGFRYHGFFLGSACFVLIYDFIFDRRAAIENLPYVHAALHILSRMRQGDPIASTMKALQTILRAIDPSFEWDASSSPPSLCTLTAVDRSVDRNVSVPEHPREHQGQGPGPGPGPNSMQMNSPSIVKQPTSHVRWEPPPEPARPRSTPLQPQKITDFLINTSDTPGTPMSATPHVTADPYVQAMAGPVLTGDYFPVTGGSLPDFSASDLGWDFATMDLEAFFSVYPTGAN
ncbi:hypothetical protein KEM56_000383 [Ascosphaera pollenicola]|nr:hypothetical protein KEM56_000383 [Ascosphaera pollenicola]